MVRRAVRGLSVSEKEELERWLEIIWAQAREFGLDPCPTHFEVVPQHVIYELGAYGLPAGSRTGRSANKLMAR
jgi:spore cortex formation protein SpoVR/YcgB (stage V sporulation)